MLQIVKDSDTRPWFFLQTAHTTYGIRVMETGHLEHLYYGERITVDAQDPSFCAPLVIQRAFAPGNTCTYDREHPQISMEDVCLEIGTLGKGDIREPFLEVRFADGSVTSDFTFDSYEENSACRIPDFLTVIRKQKLIPRNAFRLFCRMLRIIWSCSCFIPYSKNVMSLPEAHS